MPTARKDLEIEGVTVPIEIDFEVWCRNCGSGICSSTKYKKGSDNNFTTGCDDCDKDREREQKALSDALYRVEMLENDVKTLELEAREAAR